VKIVSKGLLLGYGLFRYANLHIVGRLPVSDLLMMCALPIFSSRRLLREPMFLRLALGFSLLLIGQVLSDYVNATVPSDYLRGWALIVVSFLVTAVLIDCLIKDLSALLFYLIGLAFLYALFINPLALEISQTDSNYFKIRYVPFCNVLILLAGWALYKVKLKHAAYLLIAVYAVACFYLDARANGLIFLMSFVLLIGRSVLTRKRSANKIIMLLLVIGLGSLAYIGYVNAVLDGKIGGRNAQTQISAAKNPFNPFELLLIGRADAFALVLAISDKPFLGHGSWGKDPEGKYTKRIVLRSNDLEYSGDDPGYIRAHSVILGFWAYAGLLGFFGVCVIYYFCFQLFKRIYFHAQDSGTLFIIVILSADALWAAFFSPIQILRTSLPILIALLLSEDRRIRSSVGPPTLHRSSQN